VYLKIDRSACVPTYLLILVPINLLMKKIEVQILLYTLTKKSMEIKENMLNPIDIMSLYKVVGWFDGQNIGVKL